MLKKPRLKYCYFVEFLNDEKVLLSSENDNVLLSGKLYSILLSEIQNEGVSLEELVTRLQGKFSPFEILHALNVLEEKGYITEESPELPPGVCAYWNTQGLEVKSLLKILQEKTISFESVGLLMQDVFRQVFGSIGIKTGETGVLKVIITDDYERKELRRINREAIDTKHPWMLLKPVGVKLWIGPIFLPGITGCWECLHQRLSLNRQINTFYKLQKNTGEDIRVPASGLHLSLQIAANLTALEIVKWLYFGKNENLEGKVMTFDTKSLEIGTHMLVKRPQCKTCGDSAYKPEARPIILNRNSSYCKTSFGGYRMSSPEDTLKKHRHHVSPITGVVQRLEPYYAAHQGAPIYNYSSGHNIALRSKTLFWLNKHIRSGSGGKGKNWPQAKVGALCEAIERYSSTYHGDEPYIVSNLQELGKNGIHPNTCMNFSETQYRNREAINLNCWKFYSLVPVPFDSSLEMHWTPVYSLTEKRFKYLPSCFCYGQYPAEDELNLFSYPDSNGCAAGNSLEEAILQGFLELIERDSVALWWYNMSRKPAVDLRSFNDPYYLELIGYYKSLGRSLYVLDLTSDLQIPAFAALSHRKDDKKENIIFGFGAHVDARIGIERALVELNQILPIANVPETDRVQGRYRTQDKQFVDWLNTATMENQPYLVPLENMLVKTASDYSPIFNPNIYDSLIHCLDTVETHGLETLVLDLTQPDVGLPVVRVIVPGLRHFWRRLAPGRLYDVPIKMGWADVPLKENELNPIGLFI